MNNFKLIDEHTGNTKYFDTRAEAEEKKKELRNIVTGELTIEPVNGEEPDAEREPESVDEAELEKEVEEVEAEVVETGETPPEPVDIPDDPSIEKDPVDWLPSHFVDQIQGVPTVNRKGYAVIASKYGISVQSEPVTLPSETDFEFAEFKAIAETPEGETYTGFGSAHISREDGDDAYLLGELAETRAMKRAVAWASGVGLTAIEELQG